MFIFAVVVVAVAVELEQEAISSYFYSIHFISTLKVGWPAFAVPLPACLPSMPWLCSADDDDFFLNEE